MLDQPDLAHDERFGSNSERVANTDDLHKEIEATFKNLSSEEAIERLESAKVANARMRTIKDFLEHPQLEQFSKRLTLFEKRSAISVQLSAFLFWLIAER